MTSQTGPALVFRKMHGLGNDFVVIDGRDGWTVTPALVRALGDRHRGVGFDQLALIGTGRGRRPRRWRSGMPTARPRPPAATPPAASRGPRWTRAAWAG